jgi:hypothetical protein
MKTPGRAPELGSVTLIYFNCRWKNGVLMPTRLEFPSLPAAIRYARDSMGSPCFHDPVIVDRADNRNLLWQPRFGD